VSLVGRQLRFNHNRNAKVDFSFGSKKWHYEGAEGLVKSEGVQKVRFAVQKHFMTGYAHSLLPSKKLGHSDLDFLFCAEMGRLNTALGEVLGDKKSLEEKYQTIAENLFSNARLQKI